jgi:glycogen operon protein
VSGVGLRLGARWDGAGTTFVVYAGAAERVELCLFGGPGPGQTATRSRAGAPAGTERRVDLIGEGHHWRARLADVGPGQLYGYRVTGPCPSDPAKLLVDPYATAITGAVTWDEHLFRAGEDSARFVPRSVVTSPWFDWQDDRPPRIPWSDTVIYEAHVKGLTARHPDVPPELRGTYRGLAHPAVLEHLGRLGVTTIELLPVHHFADDRRLARAGLRNYWGYNTLGFFAPHARYAAGGQVGGQVGEFKEMVRALHRGGFEVVLDVVYNHTAEGGSGGPLLSLRGLDERAYYRLDQAHHDEHVNWTGCGNTVNVDHPAALRLVLDSLRYWVTEMHVDGFRFDLATTLGRDGGRFDPGAAFFDAVYQDPVLSQVKLIAEPWDLGPDGYQLGQFPLGWVEWNDRYRDAVRDFWRGQPGTLGGLASRLAGSADTFPDRARGPLASVNFAACHDGFTLADLVTYEAKRNEANGEANNDGANENRSWNCGVEGPTDVPLVSARRALQQRNLLTMVFVSQGVPMLLHGDELGRTQLGNNNAYCQDNEVSWIDWSAADDQLAAFVGRLVALRKAHPVLRRSTTPIGEPRQPGGPVDMAWFTPRGEPMVEQHWHDIGRRSVVVVFDGRAADLPPSELPTRSLVVMINGGDTRGRFRIPPDAWPGAWQRELDTTEHASERPRRYVSGENLRVEPLSVVVLSGAPDDRSAGQIR